MGTPGGRGNGNQTPVLQPGQDNLGDTGLVLPGDGGEGAILQHFADGQGHVGRHHNVLLLTKLDSHQLKA